MTSHHLETRLCFDAWSLRGPEIAGLLLPESLGFVPQMIRARDLTNGVERFSKKIVERVRRLEVPTVLSVTADDGAFQGPSFFVRADPGYELQTLSWKLPGNQEVAQATLDYLLDNVRLNAGYVFDSADVLRQSARTLSAYRVFGWSTKGVRVLRDQELPSESVDVSRNPGRADILPGMWFIAGWKNWFAGKAFAYFEKRRVLEFAGSVSARESPTGRVFIQLFEDPFGSGSRPNRAVQRRFRDWLRCDDVIRAIQDRESSDWGINIEIGRFEHGGVRRATVRRDASGRVAARPLAASVVVVELDEAGDVVWVSQPRKLPPGRGARKGTRDPSSSDEQ